MNEKCGIDGCEMPVTWVLDCMFSVIYSCGDHVEALGGNVRDTYRIAGDTAGEADGA